MAEMNYRQVGWASRAVEPTAFMPYRESDDSDHMQGIGWVPVYVAEPGAVKSPLDPTDDQPDTLLQQITRLCRTSDYSDEEVGWAIREKVGRAPIDSALLDTHLGVTDSAYWPDTTVRGDG